MARSQVRKTVFHILASEPLAKSVLKVFFYVNLGYHCTSYEKNGWLDPVLTDCLPHHYFTSKFFCKTELTFESLGTV